MTLVRSIPRRAFVAATLAAVPVGRLLAGAPSRRSRLILLGTAGGPTPKPNRAAPSQAIVVGDSTYIVDYAYLLRDSDGSVRVEHDRHVEGLFPRATWLRLFAEAGFRHNVLPLEHSELEPGSHEVFICVRPASSE